MIFSVIHTWLVVCWNSQGFLSFFNEWNTIQQNWSYPCLSNLDSDNVEYDWPDSVQLYNLDHHSAGFHLLYYFFSSAILTSFFKSRFMNQRTIRHFISVLFRSNSFTNFVCMYGDSVNILNLWVDVSNFQLSLTMLGVMLPLRKLHLFLCRKAGNHTLPTIPFSKFLCLETLIISGSGRPGPSFCFQN